MILLVDCGNTSAKWRLLDEDGRHLDEQREEGAEFAKLLVALKRELLVSAHIRVYVASVASSQVRQNLERALLAVKCTEYSVVDIQVVPEFKGLRIAYDDPRQLGVDRWLAMLAAYHQSKSAVLLVSVGTAVTVDKISSGGEHLGGLIAPGWRLLKDSLAQGTANLSAASSVALIKDRNLGANTVECLELGLSEMLLSFVSSAAAQFGKDVSRKIIMGGDSAAVAACLDIGFDVQESLVLDGLAFYCAEHEGIY